MNEIEREDAARRRLLWGSLVAFGLWQAGDLLARGFDLAPATQRGVIVFALVAWAIWCVFLLRTAGQKLMVASAFSQMPQPSPFGSVTA